MPRENTLGACFERLGLHIGAKLTRLSTKIKIIPASPEKTYRDGAAALRRVDRLNELNGICFEYTHPGCRDQDWDWETPRRRSAVSQLTGTGTSTTSDVGSQLSASIPSSSSSSSSSNASSSSSSSSSGPRFSISSSSSRSSCPEPASIDLDFEVPVLDTATNLMTLKTGLLRQSAPIIVRS